MKDLKYIFKRIIIGVAIGFILFSIKSCNVKAAPMNLTPSGCAVWYSNTNSQTGTVGSFSFYGLTYFSCTLSSQRALHTTRYTYSNLTSGIDGYGTMSFGVVSNSGEQITKVSVLRGGIEYYCNLNTGTILPYTPTAGQTITNSIHYDVNCNNVILGSTSTYIINIYYYGNLSTGQEGAWISRTISFSSSAEEAINNQSTQQHTDSQNTQNAINDVNDSITSSTTPSSSDTSSAYSSFDNATAQNGVITSLITLPIQLFTNINNNINSSCTRFDMGTLLGTHIYFNCIQPQNYIGSQLWSVIDILMSGFFVWYIGKKLIKVFENLSSMKEGDPVGD